jgi:type IV secretory pathway TrbD component
MQLGETIAGFHAPVYRALTNLILLGGAAVAIANGTVAAAVSNGLRLWLIGILMWAVGHVAVWATKEGSFQRTARFRGPDLDNATPAELIGTPRASTAPCDGLARRFVRKHYRGAASNGVAMQVGRSDRLAPLSC